MQLNSDDVLVKYANIWNLLCAHAISLIDIFNKFNCTKNVLEVVAFGKDCVTFVYIPESLIFRLRLQKFFDFVDWQWFTVLVVRAAFFAIFTRNIVSIEACSS